MVRIACVCAAAVLAVGALGGCAATTDAEALTPPAASAEADPPATATAAPSTSIEFVNVPATMRGTDADVYSAIAVYERQLWRATTDGELGLSLYEPGTATDDAATTTVTGNLRVGIRDIVVDEGTATGLVCRDFSQLTIDSADSRIPAADAGYDAPRAAVLSLRLMEDDVWRIEDAEQAGTC